VKKAQHGGRFDSVDFAPSPTGHSNIKATSAAAKGPLRRSEQTIHDLTAMNTQDHEQRSMQREGSFILARSSESRQDVSVAGRPIFTGDNSSSSTLTSAYAAYRLDRAHAMSPSSSPRVRSGTATTIIGLHPPRRPATAHPSRSPQRQPSLNVHLADMAAAPATPNGTLSAPIGTIAAPQTPDVSQLQHPMNSDSNRSQEQSLSQQSSHASPLSSSRSKRCSFCPFLCFSCALFALLCARTSCVSSCRQSILSTADLGAQRHEGAVPAEHARECRRSVIAPLQPIVFSATV
jgi:hypothetical protein